MSQKISLPENVILLIQKNVSDIKSEYQIEEIVKDDIFQLLEKKCTVIYFPLKNEKNRGFHIKKLVNDKLEDFVFINTDKTIEQQVFTAAHELGHVYNIYENIVKTVSLEGNILDINDQEYEEKVTDRFAAEFIMPEQQFINVTRKYAIDFNLKNDVSILDMLKLIAFLMDVFMSPFNAVRKRLFEINAIDNNSDKYLSKHKDELEKYINVLKNDENSLINGKTGVRTISGLRSFIDEASLNSNTDKLLIEKIRKDFALEDIQIKGKIRFSGENIE